MSFSDRTNGIHMVFGSMGMKALLTLWLRSGWGDSSGERLRDCAIRADYNMDVKDELVSNPWYK